MNQLELLINPPVYEVKPTQKQKRMLYMREYRLRKKGGLPDSPTDTRPFKIHYDYRILRPIYEPT